MAKITSILIGLVIVSLIVGIFAVYLSNGSSEYGFDDYNNSQVTTFNKMNQVSILADNITSTESQFQTEGGSGIPDVLGLIFNNGYKVLRLTKDSIGITDSLVSDGLNNIGVGDGIKNIFKTAIMTIVIIIIIVGVIIAAIVKRDL